PSLCRANPAAVHRQRPEGEVTERIWFMPDVPSEPRPTRQCRCLGPKEWRKQMNSPIPLVHFDRSKPFYPLVIQYVMQLASIKDFALRGVIGPPKFRETATELFSRSGPGPAEIAKATEHLDAILAPLELKSAVRPCLFTVTQDEIAKELV